MNDMVLEVFEAFVGSFTAGQQLRIVYEKQIGPLLRVGHA
jgi:hypothetical protein